MSFNPSMSSIYCSVILFLGLYMASNLLNAQSPVIQSNTDEQALIPITNKGIYIHKIEKGKGPNAQPGDYIFSRFIISYKDSILNRSKPDAIDNVIFIPIDFDKHPNGALYEVFTYARAGDQLIFDMPFKMLPWKDPNLGDNDSIRYHIYIDSIKNESEYVLYYEQYLDELQSKIDADNLAKSPLGDEIRNLAERHLKDKTSPFQKNNHGQLIYKIKASPEVKSNVTTGKVRFKYMALVLKDGVWDDTYFNTLLMEANIGSGEIPLQIEQVLKGMNPYDQWLTIIEERNTDPSINQELQTLCIWMELLE
jgi:hypothetical protein